MNVSADAIIHGLTVGRGGNSQDINSVAVGQGSLSGATPSTTDMMNNTAIGSQSLNWLSSGNNNTAVGCSAGSYVSSGTYNTFLGYNASAFGNVNYSRSTAIGYGALIDSSDQIVLGKTTDVISGSPTVYIPGRVGIGNSKTRYELDVSGYIGAGSMVMGGLNIGNNQCSHRAFYQSPYETVINGSGPNNALEPINFKINNVQKVRIDICGNVGIGTITPQTALHVIGTITATNFNATSDLRLKDNINDLSNSLEKICAIRGVEYTWKGDDTKKLQSGVIAQEVNMIIPEAVNTSNPDTMTVNYNAIIGHLIESIKTLKQEVDNLKSQLPLV